MSSSEKENLAIVPQLRVVPVGEANRFRKSGHIEQHIARAENKLGQFAVDAVDEVSQRSRKQRGPGFQRAFPPAAAKV